MRARLVRTSPGTGKTRAVSKAVQRQATRVRIVTGSLNLAFELAAEYGYALVQGRNEVNCQRFEVARALGEAGYEVAAIACGRVDEPRCPFRNDCGYWRQFEASGPRVAAAEQLFNPNFLRGGNLAVVDDADLSRSLIERYFITSGDLVRAHKLLKGTRREPLRRLLVALTAAIMEAPPAGYNGLAARIAGASVWDYLVRASRLWGRDFVALLEALPETPSLPKLKANVDGVVTQEALDEAAPATILHLVRALGEELPYFLTSEDFNSRLRLSSDGIEVRRLREPVRDDHGVVLIEQMPLLILDATPVTSLVDHLTQRHDRLPDVEATVRLPENVSVSQYATSGNGHTVLSQPEKVQDVLAEVAAERLRRPVAAATKEAVVCFKRHRKTLVEAGFLDERVVTFGSVRGTNVLAAVERLHVIGRPMPPAEELAYLAQVIHFGQAPVSGQLVLRPRAYGGQRYEIDVLDFADARAAALLANQREDEILQALHRARLFALDDARIGLDEGEEKEGRRRVHLVLHTSQPVPGLRVDELVVTAVAKTKNEARQEDAQHRIRAAVLQIEEMCEPVTAVAVARLATASRRTVNEYLRTSDHTHKRDLLNKGVITLPQTKEALSASSPREIESAAAGQMVNLCRGGCGKPMPPGQMCHDCATTATEQWVQRTKRRPRA